MKVIISGSRSILTLPKEAKLCERASAIASIDKIIALGFEILVGDAPGVDAAVQRYLKSKGYSKVTVYFVGNKPRFNAGFPSVVIVGKYTDRDRYMCCRADYGLAIWDGISKGTAENIRRVPKTRVVIVK
jgi:adenine-specific DNA-methyltransferase